MMNLRRFNFCTKPVTLYEGPFDVEAILREKLYELDGGQDEALLVCNLTDVAQKFNNWRTKMPRVKPFYAVKCNDDDNVIRLLALLGAGFDCASRAEINAVLKHGVTSDRIIFANPAKPSSHIRHAATTNTRLMTFDSTTELEKIHHIFPDAKLLLRIRCDAKEALCILGEKFGCNPVTEAPRLLMHAMNLNLNVVGICFHVGSGCMDPLAYGEAIAASRELFDYAHTLGYRMSLLDIGGGFPGNTGMDIGTIADVVNTALDNYFPSHEDTPVEVIAEPGRYFVASAYTIGVTIHSKNEILQPDGTLTHIKYYVNDGIYGCFNDVVNVFDIRPQKILRKDTTPNNDNNSSFECSIWGQSCDGIDKICVTTLPNLDIGSVLVFSNMGAYTITLSSAFNGYSKAKILYFADNDTLKILEGSQNNSIEISRY